MNKKAIPAGGFVFFLVFLAFALPVLMPGCAVLDYTLQDTVHPDSGAITLSGLKADASVRRDELGIPVVEAQNMHDLIYAAGYVMAADRLFQMVSYCLIGQGRLSEMTGGMGIDIDLLIRTLGLPRAAREQYEQLDPEQCRMLQYFADGVNAYMATHQEKLPVDFAVTGYIPEAWEPINSIYIFHVLNLGLSFNLREEIAFLNLAGTLGPEKAAWLFPIHPDEPLPFEKAAVLGRARLADSGIREEARALEDVTGRLERVLLPLGTPASNNWAVGPERTAKGASIVANDTHLPLSHPPIWMLMQLKAPGFHAAGVAMPGIPAIVAGYNGHVAWGMTMVMGDSQDVFLERIKKINGRDHYVYQGGWHPVKTRRETLRVKGGDPVEQTIRSTRQGPLLNSALSAASVNPFMPPETTSDFGLALRSALNEGVFSFDGMYDLLFATSMQEAGDAIRGFRVMNLNFIYGSAEHIGWQVSGRYPIRKNGRGHLPSPGWTGDYDWQGFLPPEKHPHARDPESGYVYTANNRTIPPEQDPQLGSSWYAPERAERIDQMLADRAAYDWQDAVQMQNDRHDLLVEKMQQRLFDSPLASEIHQAIDGWQDAARATRARQALAIFREFDGDMTPDSAGAALTGIFHHVLTRNLFLDELGPESSSAWESFRMLCIGIYGPEQDHLLARPMSPFWDDVQTPEKIETKSDIIAATLADAVSYARRRMGHDPDQWQWGEIHTYTWETEVSKMRDQLPLFKRFGAWLMAGYTDRGPYPGGGGFNTLNVAGYHKGYDFDVWMIPAMRMVVDFGRNEPLFLVNSGGQSGNPASAHYDDGIPVWLKGGNRQMSYRPENLRKQYDRVFTLNAPNK